MFSQPTHANETVPYFGDMPIMSGFSYLNDSLIVFDKPQGQIVEASLICEVNCSAPNAIRDYYHRTLSNLGWVRHQTSSYVKKQQQLTFDIKSENQSVIVVFQRES